MDVEYRYAIVRYLHPPEEVNGVILAKFSKLFKGSENRKEVIMKHLKL